MHYYYMSFSKEFQTNVPNAKWSIKFNKTMNKAYNVEINVGQRYLFFDYTLASSSLKVNITSMCFSFLNSFLYAFSQWFQLKFVRRRRKK